MKRKQYEKFRSPLEAARYAVTLNEQWDANTGDIWDSKDVLGVFECAEDDAGPLDEDDPDHWYVVDEAGSVGITEDNGDTVEWIAWGWAQEKPQKTVCPKCGKPVKAGAKFCRSCGAKLEAAPPPQPERPAPVEERRCPKCGKPVKAGAKFCRSCGAKLKVAPPPQPECPAPVEERRCPKCGKPVKAGAKFCRSCGARLEAAPPPQPEQPALVLETLCPKCGKPVKAGTKFCRSCGAKLEPDPASEPGASSLGAAAVDLAEQAARHLGRAVVTAASEYAGEQTMEADAIQQAALAAAIKAMRGGQ